MGSSIVRVGFALLLVVAGACAPATQAPRRAAAHAATQTSETIRVGTSGDYPPLSLWKDDRAEGFAPALIDAFARVQGLDIGWSRFRWPDLSSDFRSGRFDLVADGITVRPERSIAGSFTVPIARGGAVLLVRRPAWAKPTRDLAVSELGALDRPEFRVVVNRGGHLERITRSLLPHADVRAIPDNAGVREALARGETDGAMTNTFEAPRWAEGLAGIERIGPLTRDVTALWLRADRPDLAERLDAWLLDEEANGHLAELRARTIGPGAGDATAQPVSALIAATSERLALMPFVAAAKEKANLPIEDAGQEDRVLAAAYETVTKAATKGKARGAPPTRELVDAFFRAQIEMAKVVQRPGAARPSEPSFTLDRDLRPAIARITARMAFLLVRVPRGTTLADVLAEARVVLSESGLAPDGVDRLASAIVAFGQR